MREVRRYGIRGPAVPRVQEAEPNKQDSAELAPFCDTFQYRSVCSNPGVRSREIDQCSFSGPVRRRVAGPDAEKPTWFLPQRQAKSPCSISGLDRYTSDQYSLATIFFECDKRPRKKCGSKVEAAHTVNNPLSYSYLSDFMVAREEVRVRRELLVLPPSAWYTHEKFRWMRCTRLTNVHREDDRTTREFRRLCHDVQLQWASCNDKPRLARLFVFNCALWRAFGTVEFAREVGFLTNIENWDETSASIILGAAVRVWRRGQQCFTNAYRPPGLLYTVENSSIKAQDEGLAVCLYRKACLALIPLWRATEQISNVALKTRSWEQVMNVLMKVHGFGGTGFFAKEIVQDLIHTPLFQDWDAENCRWENRCIDTDSWCVVGPGARRGLNRLHGRCVGNLVYDTCPTAHQSFLAELREVYAQCLEAWPAQILGYVVVGLDLHDVQFQLCELDKHERAKYSQGRVRRYTPPADPNPW